MHIFLSGTFDPTALEILGEIGSASLVNNHSHWQCLLAEIEFILTTVRLISQHLRPECHAWVVSDCCACYSWSLLRLGRVDVARSLSS